jgi:hypothetical protein
MWGMCRQVAQKASRVVGATRAITKASSEFGNCRALCNQGCRVGDQRSGPAAPQLLTLGQGTTLHVDAYRSLPVTKRVLRRRWTKRGGGWQRGSGGGRGGSYRRGSQWAGQQQDGCGQGGTMWTSRDVRVE